MRRKIFFVMVMMIGCMTLLQSEKVYAAENVISGDEEQIEENMDWREERDGKTFYSPSSDVELDLVSVNSLTDEQKLQRLMEIDRDWEFDADIIDWWIAFPCDDQIKYNYFITRQSNIFSKTICNWIINNENFTKEQKVQYIRSREYGQWRTYSDILNWWYINVGQPLSSYETTRIDALNYEQYLRQSYLDKYGVSNIDQIECVNTIDKSKGFYILEEDCKKAVAEGLIEEEVHYYSLSGGTSYQPMIFYITNNYDAIAKKYKIWNYK